MTNILDTGVKDVRNVTGFNIGAGAISGVKELLAHSELQILLLLLMSSLITKMILCLTWD